LSKIYVAVPNLNWIHRFAVQKLIDIAVSVERDEEVHDLRFDFHSDKPVDSCRNKTITKFLDSGFEWYYTMDSDNPPLGNPLEHIDKDYDILAFPTPIWYSEIMSRQRGEPPIVWNCFDWCEDSSGWREHQPQSGIQQIGAAGSGSMLINRRVLEKVRPAFVRRYNEFGEVTQGSDLLFCKRATDIGFKVYADYNNPCSHYKEVDLTHVYKAMKSRDVTGVNRENINTAEYWNDQWEKRPDRQYETFDYIEKRIMGFTNGQKPFRVLDFGCGRGTLMDRLSAINGVEVYGVDFSSTAIERVIGRGLRGAVGTEPIGKWDCIVCTEVLEHIDNDSEMVKKFFDHSDRLIFTVPDNCYPPGLEPEHRRCYTEGYVKRITPHIKEISHFHQYMLVVADKSQEKEADCGSS